VPNTTAIDVSANRILRARTLRIANLIMVN
jgi:hypothetical protein